MFYLFHRKFYIVLCHEKITLKGVVMKKDDGLYLTLIVGVVALVGIVLLLLSVRQPSAVSVQSDVSGQAVGVRSGLNTIHGGFRPIYASGAESSDCKENRDECRYDCAHSGYDQCRGRGHSGDYCDGELNDCNDGCNSRYTVCLNK